MDDNNLTYENKENALNTLDALDKNAEYLETIEKLKLNSVEKSKYENDINNLLNEKKKLLDIISKVGSTGIEAKNNKELVDIINNRNTNNLDYVKAALELRDNVLKQESIDIFEGRGHIMDKQLVNGDHVATVLKSIIESSDDSSEVFTALLNNALSEGSRVKNIRR
jgi:hypothetical protein